MTPSGPATVIKPVEFRQARGIDVVGRIEHESIANPTRFALNGFVVVDDQGEMVGGAVDVDFKE